MRDIKPNRASVLFVSVVACLLFVAGFVALPSLAAAPPLPEIPQAAPLNPDFLDFIQSRPTHFYGYIPPPVDLSHLKKIPVGEPTAKAPTPGEPLALPAVFDWRTSGNVTPVKDQNPCGTCWIFGTLAAIESSVLIGENAAFDFSDASAAGAGFARCLARPMMAAVISGVTASTRYA